MHILSAKSAQISDFFFFMPWGDTLKKYIYDLHIFKKIVLGAVL
jgi:hypothetical protein